MFHYRLDFLSQLEIELKKYDVALDVFYGKPTPESIAKNDTAELIGSTQMPSWCLRIGGKEILLQIPPKRILSSNLVICMQENRLLINYIIQLYTRIAPGVKFAYWGHGRNFQSRRATGARETLKRFLLRGSDWFFAYTEASKNSLIANGYDPGKITVFNNTIDTDKFRCAVEKISKQEKQSFLEDLSIAPGDIVALFCGSMYPAKRIEELLASCDLIKEKVPGFHLICIGDGPSAKLIQLANKTHSWIHYLGVQTGQQKALAFSVGKAVLNPGLVGLHIVDSFSAGVPMITMDYEFHSPEFAYMRSGENGLVTCADVGDYAAAVVAILTDPTYQVKLAGGARQSADEYSLKAMVDKYTSGILKVIQR